MTTIIDIAQIGLAICGVFLALMILGRFHGYIQERKEAEETLPCEERRRFDDDH